MKEAHLHSSVRSRQLRHVIGSNELKYHAFRPSHRFRVEIYPCNRTPEHRRLVSERYETVKAFRSGHAVCIHCPYTVSELRCPTSPSIFDTAQQANPSNMSSCMTDMRHQGAIEGMSCARRFPRKKGTTQCSYLLAICSIEVSIANIRMNGRRAGLRSWAV